MIERIFRSLIANIKNIVTQHLLIPCIIAICICICYLIIVKLKNKNVSYKVLYCRTQLLKIVTLFISSLYFSIIIEVTLIKRIGSYYEPFSMFWNDWSIFDTELTMYVNFMPISNTIMFLPFAFIISTINKYFFNNRYTNRILIKYSILYSFLCSITVELLQAITKLGTFQLSDLFYNTLGGLIGALIYISAKKFISNKKLRVHK